MIHTLEMPFNREGFRHELVERSGNVVLVRRSKPGLPTHFEVAIIRFGKPHPLSGLPDSDRVERYPRTEQWGAFGWTYQTQEQARIRFEASKLRAGLQPELEGYANASLISPL
jgi:hypothetical protein